MTENSNRPSKTVNLKPQTPAPSPSGHARMVYKDEHWEYGSHEIMWSRYWHDLAVWGEQEVARLTAELAKRGAHETTEVYTQEALDAAHARTRERLAKLKTEESPEKAGARPIPQGRMCNTHGNWNCSECCPPENGSFDWHMDGCKLKYGGVHCTCGLTLCGGDNQFI